MDTKNFFKHNSAITQKILEKKMIILVVFFQQQDIIERNLLAIAGKREELFEPIFNVLNILDNSITELLMYAQNCSSS